MAKKGKSNEFEPSVYADGEGKEPRQSDMGASILDYGEQRFGEGIDREEPETYAEPGEEGRIAIAQMRECGGISSHESFDNIMHATPTGE